MLMSTFSNERKGANGLNCSWNEKQEKSFENYLTRQQIVVEECQNLT